MKIQLRATLIAAAVLSSLVACGGGGSSGNPNNNSGADGGSGGGDVAVSASADLWAALNAARSGAGAGALVQDARIDSAAAAHASYLAANNLSSHEEVVGQPGFYEATPAARLAKAGFTVAGAGEAIDGVAEAIASVAATERGRDCARRLLGSVYHAVLLLSEETHAGVGVADNAAAASKVCVIDLSIPAPKEIGQLPASGQIVMYPYAGQTGVLTTFQVGNETPRPPAALLPNPTAGHPVVVSLRNADWPALAQDYTLDPIVTRFELKDADGNLVPSVILSSVAQGGPGVTLHQDPQLPYDGFVVLVPSAPLAAGKTYTAAFEATLKSGATPLVRSVSFTTAP